MTDDFRGPAALGFDWEHILEAHSNSGKIARQSGKKDIFAGLSADQIKASVQAAWKQRQKIKTQRDSSGAERIKYRGKDLSGGRVIEYWFNLSN
jgi:shikimate kinase